MVEASAMAVIGMAGRFPGAADPKALWENLRAGLETVHRFTDDELRAAGETEEALADPTYVKACGRLDGIECFDAGFFGMSPRDAAIFDPQHRVFLECAWEALERAGYMGESVAGPIGVFATCGMSEYMIKNLMTNPEVMTEVGPWLVRHTGNDTNFLATRVSYELNLRGPSVNVQTACSSGLVAIHLACQSLLNGECDLALAGGATVYPEQNKGYFWRDGEIQSPDGHTRSFDAGAAGTTLSSAAACVVLKRLDDALRDGDTVLAVVRGSAINNDGHDKVGYLAPSVSGQARAVIEALEIAGVSPEEVSYVEAHGTATRIGDPIEIAALTQAYRASTDKTGYCAIGSLKSNIGHTGEASGAAAFVKAVLALQNRMIPPSLNYESPNPQCEFGSSPFFVNTKLRPWDAPRRICGVTSLGAGGTNCHVVLEEAPLSPMPAPARTRHVLVVSAKTEAALEAATKNLAQHFEGDPEGSLADAAFTLAVGRKAFRHRRAVVAKDTRDAAHALRAGGGVTGEAGEPPKVALVFPDAGAVAPDAELAAEPAFREAMDACLAVLRTTPEALAPDDLQMLFAVEYATAKLLLSWGLSPAAFIGHGVGEHAAACAAGVRSLEDAIARVVEPASSRTPPWSSGDVADGVMALSVIRPAGDPRSDLEYLLASVGRLWTAGAMALGGLYEGQRLRRAPLPTYPWQRRKYWIAPGATVTAAATKTAPAFERPEVRASFVAPRTAVEEELAAMWRELLGVDRVGARDDFFELGGQSLVAVRFFTRVRKSRGVDLPLTTLLEAPTIEKLAAIVEAASRPAPGFRSLVPIQRGDGRRPFFCVHGAGGNVLNFRDLSRALRAEQPFYGLQARGIDGALRPHASIEEMAAAYLEEVRALQRNGPYMLGGYSGGGLVALEMAQRLGEAGERVELLALIDTFHPATPVRKMTFARRLERARDEGSDYLRRAIEDKVAGQRTRRQLEEAARLAAAGEPIPPELREAYLVENFQRAVERYRPQPWGGRAILFRAERLDYVLGDATPAYGWEDVLADVEILRVPGNHASLLLVPHASVLVEALRRAVEDDSAADPEADAARFAARVSARRAPVVPSRPALSPDGTVKSGVGSRRRWRRDDAVAPRPAWLEWVLRSSATGVLVAKRTAAPAPARRPEPGDAT